MELRRAIQLTVLALAGVGGADRVVSNFDFDWLFKLGPDSNYNATAAGDSCSNATFPIDLNGQRCDGLHPAQALTLADCRAACCSDMSCAIWQWDGAQAQSPCWIGQSSACLPDSAWSSRGRTVKPTGFQPVIPPVQQCPQSPACTDYDDSKWRSLNVPHDFVVEGTFTPTADRNHGFLPFNVSFYRKHFQVPAAYKGKSVHLYFDGIYRAADFFLNGHYIGHHESGYAPFRIYIHNATNATLNYGTENVLAVRVDALTHQEGWFYEGGGIYRHVKMVATDPVSIVPWGVYAPSLLDPFANVTGSLDEAQSSDGAVLLPQIDVAAASTVEGNSSFTLTTALYDADGIAVITASTDHQLEPGGWIRIPHHLAWPVKPPQAGYTVQEAICDGTDAQHFTYDPAKAAISVVGAGGAALCMDAGATSPTQPPMVLQPCSGAETQKWVYNAKTGNFFYQGNPKSCLDVFGVSGPQLDVFGCGDDRPSQTFNISTQLKNIACTHPDQAGLMQTTCLAAVPTSQLGHRVTFGPAADTVQLWNLKRPYLYSLVTTVAVRDATGVAVSTDTVNTTLGVRSALFDANRGFLLNGLPQKIKGLSMHQDFGGCGTAVPDRANEYRVTSLLEMGATGWRTAHNPVNSEILDYTDKHGMLVWSENRNLERQVIGARLNARRAVGDAPSPPGGMIGADWGGVDPMYLEEAQAMVLRDRNHPSIIIWSLCNEGGCMEGSPTGGFVAAAFKKAIFDVDTTRPITANSEDNPGDTLTKVMDVNSFSYNYQEYDSFHLKYPFRTIIGGESASCTSDRGRYLGSSTHQNNTEGWVDGSDVGCIISAWGSSAATRPWVVGNFAWTGWDYKGEPTPSNWPAINSHFGVIDIAGFPKDDYFYYRSWWREDPTVLHIVPNDWNAPVPVGTALDAVVYSAAAEIELTVNGVSLGRRSVPSFGVVMYKNVTFRPGQLSATAWDATGKQVATATVKTSKAAARLVVEADADSSTILADGQDVSLIRVYAVDADGTFVPSASNKVSFSISGPGSIYGVANGDPSDHDPDKATYRKLYMGMARVLVQSTKEAGKIVLTATADSGVSASSLTITSA